MNDICLWLDKVLNWVDRCGPPAIPYIGRAPQGYHNPPAPHLEIAYLLDHRITDLAIGDKVVSIPPFHVTLLNVHQGNFTPTMQPFDSWCLFLDVGNEPEFADLNKGPLFCCAPLPLNEEAIAAFERLGGLCVRYSTGRSVYLDTVSVYDPALGRSANPAGAFRVKAALLDLLALLRDVLEPGRGGPSRPPAVQRAIEFMSLHYRHTTLTRADVARAAGLSLDHFGRLFRQHMGETPMHYLRAMRIHQARHLLEHTELLVEEIASEVGFADPLHFSRVFRAITGKSPSAWRARA